MNKTVENKGNISSEKVFLDNTDFSFCGWYGLEYFELCNENDCISFYGKDEFYELYETVMEMKKEVDKLQK